MMWNKHLRRSGRTTRMLRDAVEAARQGRAVYILAANMDEHRRITLLLHGAFGDIAHSISVETPRSLTDVDIMTCTMREAHPNCQLFIDHYTIECLLAKPLEHLHKYDKTVDFSGPLRVGVETMSFADIGTKIGKVVDEKNAAYGDSFARSGEILAILYPNGVMPEQYTDMLGIVRVLDKLFRIATDQDAFGESPWNDVSGYGMLGAANHEERRRRAIEARKLVEDAIWKACTKVIGSDAPASPDSDVRP